MNAVEPQMRFLDLTLFPTRQTARCVPEFAPNLAAEHLLAYWG